MTGSIQNEEISPFYSFAAIFDDSNDPKVILTLVELIGTFLDYSQVFLRRRNQKYVRACTTAFSHRLSCERPNRVFYFVRSFSRRCSASILFEN